MSSSLQSHFKKGWRGGGNGKGLCAQSVRKEEKKFPDESQDFSEKEPPVQGNKTENGAIRESFKKAFNTSLYKIAIWKAHLFQKKNRAIACALKTALKRPFQTRYDIELKSAKSSQTRTNEQGDIVTARFCSLVSNSLFSTCVKKRWGIFIGRFLTLWLW
jgi:hypothetical protein